MFNFIILFFAAIISAKADAHTALPEADILIFQNQHPLFDKAWCYSDGHCLSLALRNRFGSLAYLTFSEAHQECRQLGGRMPTEIESKHFGEAAKKMTPEGFTIALPGLEDDLYWATPAKPLGPKHTCYFDGGIGGIGCNKNTNSRFEILAHCISP